MKYLLLTIFILLSTIARSETYIVYLNGASNVTEIDLNYGQELFKTIMVKETMLPDSIFKKYQILQTKLESIDAILCQQNLSFNAMFPIFRSVPEISEYPKYYEKLALNYKNPSSTCTFLASTRVLNYTSSIAAAASSMIDSGNKIIFVGHSQGSYYTEAVAAILINKYGTTAWNKIKVINIASLSATNISDYITFGQDQAVYSERNIYIWPHVQNVKYNACIYPCQRIATLEELKLISKKYDAKLYDEYIHGITTYLNKDIYIYESKIPAYKMIANSIKTAYFQLEKHDYIKSKKPTYISTIQGSTTLTSSLKTTLNKTLAFFGIRNAVATVLPSLFAYTNSNFTVRVEGTGFDGNEAVSIEGAICNVSTIVRGSGYFTQNCVAGSVASDTNKVRVYDTQYDLDIEVPPAYQLMSLRGPVLAPLAPTLTNLGNGTVRSTWGAVAGATGYELYRSAIKVATLGAVTQYDESGLAAGSQACYRVKTIANGTVSALSGESCITLPVIVVQCNGQWSVNKYVVGAVESTTQACSAGYTGNKVLSHTCQATGSWGVTTTQDNCTVIPTPTCSGTWHTGVKYLVGQVEDIYQNTCPAGTQGQVRSFHTCLSANNWSATAQSDNCTAYLATPTDIRTSNVNNGVQITWAAVSGATSYRLYKNSTNSIYRETTTNSFVDEYVTHGSSYNYAVSAYSNRNGQNVLSPASTWSQIVYQSGQIGINPPTNVTAGQYTQYSQKGIRLQWTGAPLADSYFIYRRGYFNPYTSAALLAPVSGGDISFFDSWSNFSGSIVPGNSYCYYIRAVRGSTVSVDSNEACSMAP